MPSLLDSRAMETTVHLTTEFIALTGVIKLAGLVGSGGHAKMLVQDGHVRVNGAVEMRRGAKVRPGDVVEIDAEEPVHITVA